MNSYTVDLIGVFIVGIEVGVLLCLIFQTLTQRRREQDQARRQIQLETEALRRDLESLRRDIGRRFSAQSNVLE